MKDQPKSNKSLPRKSHHVAAFFTGKLKYATGFDLTGHYISYRQETLYKDNSEKVRGSNKNTTIGRTVNVFKKSYRTAIQKKTTKFETLIVNGDYVIFLVSLGFISVYSP